jgi:hypothetical protein
MNSKLKIKLIASLVLISLVIVLIRVAKKDAAKPVADGLNTQLPSPRAPKDSWWGKMDFYKQAEQDSARYISRKNEDRKGEAAQRPDSSAAGVYSGLAGLREVLRHPAEPPAAVPAQRQVLGPAPPLPLLLGAAPAQPLLSSTAAVPPRLPDPELQQLSVMLDKVMAIQHAEQATASPQTSFLHGPSSQAPSPPGSLTLDTATAMEAITETEGTLTSGSVIALRISADVVWHGLFIPRNTLVYGIGALENERLHIRVHSIRMGDLLCSVSLEAYDLDGIEGIYVPGSLGRDASKASADEAINGLNGTYDPTIGGQAANAGIQTLKSLFSKKVKEVRVTVRAGYAVLLK